MTWRPEPVVVAGALLAAAAAGACGTRAPTLESTVPSAYTLIVDNRAFHDMRIFIEHEGAQQRIGTVTGNTSARFDISRWMARTRTSVNFFAIPVGSPDRAQTGPIYLVPGETLRWNLANQLNRSSYLIYTSEQFLPDSAATDSMKRARAARDSSDTS